MKRAMLAVACCVGAAGWLIAANSAFAQQSWTITVMGDGKESCGTWTVDRQLNASEADQEYVVGFVAGEENELGGILSKSIAVNTDAYGIFGWIDNFCRTHPTDYLDDAAAHFVGDSNTVRVGQ